MKQRLMKEKKRFQLPHVFVLLSSVALIISVMTYFLPAGSYERVVDELSGRTVVVADSFQFMKNSPVSVMQFLTAYSKAFVNSASIIFMTLVVGGAVGIINRLKILPALLSLIAVKMKHNKIWVIPLLMLFLGLLDSFLGACELCIVFLPIVLPLILDLGFDTITACAVVICGNCVGFVTGMGNPFNTIISQKICGLPLYSAFGYRALCFVIFYVITVLYVVRYAKQIQKNPSLSRTYEKDLELHNEIHVEQTEQLSTRKKAAGFFAISCFLLNIAGVIKFGWDLPEMTGIFIVMAMGSGLIAGHTLSETSKLFMEGTRDILQGALVICFARTISVLLTEANVIDLLVYYLSKLAASFPAQIAVIGLFAAATITNFFIPSSSGQAAATMPLFSPLGDVLGITQQTSVLASQFGDGWSNTIFPTNASYMATLAVGGVNWTDWIAFQMPLFCIWTGVSCVMLFIAQCINLGPF